MAPAKGLTFVLAWLLVTPRALAEENSPTDPSADTRQKHFRVALGLDRMLFLGPFTQDGSRGESGIAVAAASFVKSTAIKSTGEPLVPHAIARLGVDVALPWRLTLGIAGGYGVVMDTPDNGAASERSVVAEETSVSTTVLQTRFGYTHPLKGSSFFWFRAGLAYTFASIDSESASDSENGRRVSIHHLSVPIDFVFVMPFTKNFGITYGLSADLGLFGVDTRRVYGFPTPTEKDERRVNDGVGMWFGVQSLL